MRRVYFITALDLTINTAGRKRLLSMAKSIENESISTVFYSLTNGRTYLTDNYEIIQEEKNKRHLLTISIFLYRIIKDLRHNKDVKKSIILYPTSFQLFDLFAIIILRTLTNVKLFIDLNEVRRYSIRFMRKDNFLIFFKKSIQYILSVLMDQLYQIAHGHIYISTAISNFYNKKKSIIIPIMCNNYNDVIRHIKNYDNDQEFNIGFAGSIDCLKEKFDNFFESIRILNYSFKFNVKINLYGIITNVDSLYSNLSNYDIESFVNYRGLIDQNELINTLWKENHALILPRSNTKQNHYGFSTKLTDYIEAQAPIITSSIGDVETYFINGINAIVYKVDSLDDMINKISNFIVNYNSVAPIIVSGGNKLLIEKFHYSVYSKALSTFILPI